MTKNHITYTFDGYQGFPPDGYTCDYQLNIKLSASDMQEISDIRKEFFENEITTSTLGRILLHKGIAHYKRMRNSTDKHSL